MKHHKFCRLVIIALVFLIMSQVVASLGLSPAKKVIDFAPNKEETITFNLINNEKKDLRVFVEVTGELAQYVEIPNNIVTINKDEKSKGLDLAVILPENFERAGLIESKIRVSQVSDVGGGTMQISAAPSLKARLQLRVPYPSKYIESRLIVDKDDKNVRLVMPMFNYGKEDIENARAFLKIFDTQNNLIKELETLGTSIESGSQAKLSAGWQAENIGAYYAMASIDYDGKRLGLKEGFIVGLPFVNITRIVADNFELGDIARFDIYLKSNWNDNVNAYADALILKDDEAYLSSRTEPVELFVGEEGIVKFYWETEGIAEGDYNLSLTIKHELGESKHAVGLMVNEDSIMTSISPERVVAVKGIGRDMTIYRDIIIYSIVAIIVLIVVNALRHYKKPKNKKSKKRSTKIKKSRKR